MQRIETAQSAVSYGTAAGGVAAVSFIDSMASTAEAITIVIACIAVIARASYDIIRLYRYITDKDKKE